MIAALAQVTSVTLVETQSRNQAWHSISATSSAGYVKNLREVYMVISLMAMSEILCLGRDQLAIRA